MDERKLSELLRDAAGDSPPPTFTESDIAGKSRAADRKRRNVIAGSALAGVFVVCSGVAVGMGFGHTETAPSAAAPQAARPSATAGGGPSAFELSAAPSLQGDGSTGKSGPRAGGALTGCRQADGELAAALADELPSATSPARPSFQCSAGARWAGFKLSHGVIGALVVPRGSADGRPPTANEPANAGVHRTSTRSGGTLYLVSEPAETVSTARLTTVGDALAKHF